MDLIQAGQGGRYLNEKFLGDKREQDSSCTATQSEEDVFRQDALEQPASACAKRRPQSSLMITGHTPGDLQVREIGTGHQQYAGNCPQQQPERLADISSKFLGEGFDNEAEVDGEVIRRGGCLFNSVQFALRLLNSVTGFKAGDDDVVEVAVIGSQSLRRRHQRFENLVSFRRSVSYLARHDRYDRKAE